MIRKSCIESSYDIHNLVDDKSVRFSSGVGFGAAHAILFYCNYVMSTNYCQGDVFSKLNNCLIPTSLWGSLLSLVYLTTDIQLSRIAYHFYRQNKIVWNYSLGIYHMLFSLIGYLCTVYAGCIISILFCFLMIGLLELFIRQWKPNNI
jgi:hypothetical protein